MTAGLSSQQLLHNPMLSLIYLASSTDDHSIFHQKCLEIDACNTLKAAGTSKADMVRQDAVDMNTMTEEREGVMPNRLWKDLVICESMMAEANT